MHGETYNARYHPFDHNFVEACTEDVVDGFPSWEVDVLDDIGAVQEGAVCKEGGTACSLLTTKTTRTYRLLSRDCWSTSPARSFCAAVCPVASGEHLRPGTSGKATKKH